MSAIFISYTGRDPEGNAWADRLSDWFREWGYGFFRDKDHRDGVKAGDEWRATLYAELDDATAMVCLCSRSYDSSPWCVGEVAIAVEKGKTVIPIQLANTANELKQEPLPLLLQTRQAIQVAGALAPSSEQLAEVKQRLQATLREKLNWRDLQHWDRSLAPYPGLPAFEEQQSPVFFGRDKAIEAVVERLEALALRPGAFLLLLGASGYGKSSLVRAGVVPRLRGTGAAGWTVLPPFTPGDEPFKELEEAVGAVGGVFDSADPLGSLQALQRSHKKPVLLVIDQFEELLTAGRAEEELAEEGVSAEDTADQGELFQEFLLKLLRVRKPGLMVLATMRTDFLATLQSRWSALTAMASTITLEPIQPEDFGVLITGPAKRASLSLEDGLETRLVKESGGRDALPLLAFTLEKLWKDRTGQCLTLKAYDALEGVEGAVSKRAKECWDPETSSEEVRQALRETFLDHLVSVGGDGREAKRPSPMDSLPLASREIVQKMVNDRLLVLNNGIVEIAHEALLRTWEPLVKWLEENQEERLQCLRVKRLTPDLAAEAPPRQRRQALEQLAGLAAAGGGEQKAVAKEGRDPLAVLLNPPLVEEKTPPTAPIDDRADGALILALIGAEEPLSACLANEEAPVELRRRAAESLGLLAKRSGDPAQRERIERQLEGVLRGEQLDVRIEVVLDLEQLDPVMEEEARKTVDRYVEERRAAGGLVGLTTEQVEVGRESLLNDIRLQMQDEQLKMKAAGGNAPGWKEHDERLPLLQGASRGLQLAASAELPLLGSGAGRVVPMLTLTALEEGACLHITTEVVEVPVWRLPLPEGEQLELVMVPGGSYRIGSPEGEDGRTVYTQAFMKCEGVDVEAQRPVELQGFALVRQPISQAQWRAVVEATEAPGQKPLKAAPGTFRPEGLWEQHGQPGALPVDSVSWNVCRQWLGCLNGWLEQQWAELGGKGEAPQLALPSESQWEAACRAGVATPFHFGATLDERWARYDANYTYGLGRRGEYEQRPALIGFSGLVNGWGLADLHGQLREWCADQWHRDPVPLAKGDGSALEGPDAGLADVPRERENRLLRGGAWLSAPHYARAAMRLGFRPGYDSTDVGLRPGCFAPPGLLLYP